MRLEVALACGLSKVGDGVLDQFKFGDSADVCSLGCQTVGFVSASASCVGQADRKAIFFGTIG